MRFGLTRVLTLFAALATATLGIAACGGGDGGGTDSDEDRIKEAITEFAASRDASVCTETVTENFLQQSFSKLGEVPDDPVAACEQQAVDPGERPAVEIGSIDVDGDTATAEVTYDFPGESPLDDQLLTFEMVKVGDDWKADGIED